MFIISYLRLRYKVVKCAACKSVSMCFSITASLFISLEQGGGSGLGLIVYQMGRLCGGAHKISGIKAPIFLRGGW